MDTPEYSIEKHRLAIVGLHSLLSFSKENSFCEFFNPLVKDFPPSFGLFSLSWLLFIPCWANAAFITLPKWWSHKDVLEFLLDFNTTDFVGADEDDFIEFLYYWSLPSIEQDGKFNKTSKILFTNVD